MSAPIVIHEIAMPWAVQALANEGAAVLMERVDGGFDVSQLHEDGTKTLRFVVRNRLPQPQRELRTNVAKRKKFTDSLGAMTKRVRRDGARKPLRSVKELAQEFGLTVPKLVALFRESSSSPKPVIKHTSTFGSDGTWYDPQEVRKWMKSRGGK